MKKTSIKIEDKRMIIYILLSIFLYSINTFFPLSNAIKYIAIAIIILLILFEKKENALYIILFFHPISGILDSTGFLHTFNIIITIFAIKWFVSKANKLPKKLLSILIIIFFYDIALELCYGKIDSSMLSLISWMSSYIFVALCAKSSDEIDKNKCFNYFLAGFIIGIIFSAENLFVFLSDFRYRYAGLLRDPNAYSVDAIILLFSSIIIYKKISWRTILIFVFGLLSTSKMFIIVSVLGLIIYFFINFKKINIIRIFKYLLIFIVAFGLFSRTQYKTLIFDKYYDRFVNFTFSSGRSDLGKEYAKGIINKPLNFVIGGGMLNYPNIFNNGKVDGDLYSHNTYYDLILSWGIIGSLLYGYFIYLLYISIKKDKKIIIKDKKNELLLLSCFLLSMYSLSYLNADTFIIDVFLVLVFIFNDNIYIEEK